MALITDFITDYDLTHGPHIYDAFFCSLFRSNKIMLFSCGLNARHNRTEIQRSIMSHRVRTKAAGKTRTERDMGHPATTVRQNGHMQMYTRDNTEEVKGELTWRIAKICGGHDDGIHATINELECT